MTNVFQAGAQLPKILFQEKYLDSATLKAIEGKNLIIYFYPKDDTPGCTIEAKDFSCRVDEFARNNTFIIGVSKDSKKSHENFISKYDLKINLIADEANEISTAFGSLVEKSMFGKKYMGIERNSFLFDPQHQLLKAWYKVDVKNHVNEVLEFLKTL